MRKRRNQDAVRPDRVARALSSTQAPDRSSQRSSPPLQPSISGEGTATEIAVIEQRTLVRDCLTHCMKLASGHDVIAFPSVESWLEVAGGTPVSLILLCVAGRPNDAETLREVSLLAQSPHRLPVVVLSDLEDPNVIVGALDQGARGYIPTSMSLEVAVNALRLVKSGGMFVPASCLTAVTRSAACSVKPEQAGNRLFTARQAAVVEALRRGKANKIIAYELNMRESTVKVHVRNIMRKLKARNRTEGGCPGLC